jgi:hypothetical protein
MQNGFIFFPSSMAVCVRQNLTPLSSQWGYRAHGEETALLCDTSYKSFRDCVKMAEMKRNFSELRRLTPDRISKLFDSRDSQ